MAPVRAHALQARPRHQATHGLAMVDDLPWWAKMAAERRVGRPIRDHIEMLGGALCEPARHLNRPVLARASLATVATSGTPWARFMAPYTRSTTPPDTV